MMTSCKNTFVSLFFLIAVVNPVFSETYRFSSDNLSTIITQGNERTLLKGHVLVESDRKKIQAEHIELWGENYRYFTGSGSVDIRDKEKNINLKSEIFFYDKNEDLMRLNGLVVMEDYDNEMVVKCQNLENRGKEETIILQIGVRILKKDIVCRSEYAVYHRDTEILELTGLPVVHKGEDVYEADRIIVNLDTEEITMEGEVKGSLITEDENDDTEKNKEAGGDNKDTDDKTGAPDLGDGSDGPDTELSP